MRQQIFLIFLFISLLFIGFVLSEPFSGDETSTTIVTSTSAGTTATIIRTPIEPFEDAAAKDCLTRHRDSIFYKILGNDTAFDIMMSRIFDFGEPSRVKDIVVSKVLADESPGGMKQKIMTHLNCITETKECKENDLTDDAIIKKVFKNDTLKETLCKNHELSNVTHGKEMAEVVSAQNDSIKAIAKNDTQVNEFLHQEDFRKAVIKNILKNGNYRKEFIKDKEFHNAAVDFLKENSNDALKMYLKANPTSVILLKLLILSPMIIAWISSLICIASMCGCCYPFGLSEPSSSQSKVTASKSNDKKGKKSADKKEKKKHAK